MGGIDRRANPEYDQQEYSKVLNMGLICVYGRDQCFIATC